MGKNKHKRFEENKTFGCLVQPDFDEIFHKDHKLKGRWREDFFGNNNPVILELGCGRGEYTVELGEKNPGINYIGIDIKGARMWRGAKTATEKGLKNVGFLRTRIEFIESFFGEGEIDEIWITFPDPQPKRARAKKRLTSPEFLRLYTNFLKPEGFINLKTDSAFLYDYTSRVIAENSLPVTISCADIYANAKTMPTELLTIQTTYEKRFLKEGIPITHIKYSLGGKREFTAPPEDGEEE